MPADPPAEQALVGGNASGSVVRVGDTVRKPWTATTPLVVDYLAALHDQGLDVPAPLGRDEAGRLVLEYVPGESALGLAPLDRPTLLRVGALVRTLHDVSSHLPVPHPWPVLLPAPPSGPVLVCHNDLGVWNLVVGDDGRLVFVDWDGAGPSTRGWDLAYAAVSFAHVEPGAEPRDVAERLASLVEGYDVDRALREALPALVVDRARAMRDLLRAAHRSGRQPWAAMYADGHGAHWATTTAYLAQHERVWRDALA